ncbi:MAG: hypothetical protein KAZ87_07605, partial [Spirochaetes bacterium]|nr:hypothetical protein [Spirochaetota bacterium]
AHAYVILSMLLNDVANMKGPRIIYNNNRWEIEKLIDLTYSYLPDDIYQSIMDRIIWYKLGDLSKCEMIKQVSPLIPDENVKEHYGDFKKQNVKPTKLFDKMQYIADIGMQMLAKDKFHSLMIHLFKKETVKIVQGMIDDYEDKYMFWDNLANIIKRDSIDEIIVISEAWYKSLNNNNNDYQERVEDYPAKTEVLAITGTNMNKEFVSIIIPFDRINDKIIFHDKIVLYENNFVFFKPIYKVWGIT